MTYALRGYSRAFLARSEVALPSGSLVAADGDRWLLTAVRGHLGGAPSTSLALFIIGEDGMKVGAEGSLRDLHELSEERYSPDV